MNTLVSPMAAPIVERDLSSIPDYSKLHAQLADTVHEFGDANTAYATLGRTGLLDIFAKTSPDSLSAVDTTRSAVKHGIGFAVLHGTGVESVDEQTSQLVSITLGSVYGKPTKTDRRLEQVAWPIRPVIGSKVRPTFSTSTGEAAFHTDTQYFVMPEDTFGLYCVTPDVPGRGTNMLLHVDDVVRTLRGEYGNETLEQLTGFFPFRVPTVYTRSGKDSEVDVTWASILTDGGKKIRYRRDTINDALEAPGIDLPEARILAMNALDSVLRELPSTDYHLEAGDGIVINNETMLHARNDFDNPNRHLWRVRTQEDQNAL